MTPDLQTLLLMAFASLPALAAVIGLCLLARFPRHARGTAVAGLALIVIGPLLDVALHFGLYRILWRLGLPDIASALSFVAWIVLGIGLLLLGLAATRGNRPDGTGPQLPSAHLHTAAPPPGRGPVHDGRPHHGHPQAGRPGPPGQPGQWPQQPHGGA